jgi:hypothetical protein
MLGAHAPEPSWALEKSVPKVSGSDIHAYEAVFGCHCCKIYSRSPLALHAKGPRGELFHDNMVLNPQLW